MPKVINRLLAHPLTRGLAVDDPRTTTLRRRIISEKPFLRALYQDWYGFLLDKVPQGGRVLEIGSGAGFLKELMPELITSEIFPVPGVDLVADGCKLPFAAASLDGVVMTDVLHHIPDVSAFFYETARCVRPGGRIAMVEPWHTPWSGWVYRNLHPEPFEPDADWKLPASGPLSGANGALPWIVFQRDKSRFCSEFPQWKLRGITPIMPFSYLLSGGVSLRPLLPGWLYPICRTLEMRVDAARWAMFAQIELERCP